MLPTNTDAINYVVDSADRDRVGISKQNLVSILKEEELKDALLVVIANKHDIDDTTSVLASRCQFQTTETSDKTCDSQLYLFVFG